MVVGDDEVKVFESYGDRAAFHKFPALHHDIPDEFFDLLDDVMTYLEQKIVCTFQEAVPTKDMYCELCGLQNCWCPPAPPQKHDYSRLNSCQECGYPACSQECGMQRFEEEEQELQPQDLTTLFEKYHPYIELCKSCGEHLCYCNETQETLFSSGYVPSALFD
jgi:hypothetical protein